MIVMPLLLVLFLDRRRLSGDLREIDVWDRDDRMWFWRALRGYTLFRREMPPQGRFNAGQKANAIIVAAMALGFLVTGSLLLAEPHLPAWLVSRELLPHQVLAVAAIALFVGHILHAFSTRHGRDSLRAMTGGGSLLNGICDIAESILNCSTRNALACGIKDWPEELDNPVWTTAAGLSMYSARLKMRLQARRKAPGLVGMVLLFNGMQPNSRDGADSVAAARAAGMACFDTVVRRYNCYGHAQWDGRTVCDYPYASADKAWADIAAVVNEILSL